MCLIPCITDHHILYSTSSASSSSTQSRIHCAKRYIRMQTTQYYTDGSRVHTHNRETKKKERKKKKKPRTSTLTNKSRGHCTYKQTYIHSLVWLMVCAARLRCLCPTTSRAYPRTELCTFRSILAWHKLCACARLRALAGWPGWPPCWLGWLAIFCRHCVCTALQHHSLDSHLTYTHTHTCAQLAIWIFNN